MMFWYWYLTIDVIVLSSAIIINMFVLFATDMSQEIEAVNSVQFVLVLTYMFTRLYVM